MEKKFVIYGTIIVWLVEFYFDFNIVGNLVSLDNMEWTLWGITKSCSKAIQSISLYVLRKYEGLFVEIYVCNSWC